MPADEPTEDEMSDLEEELRVYDDGFPREEPTWDEDAVVTPRAFLSEYGYDVPGNRIPGELAGFLVDLPTTEPVVSLFRLFHEPEKFREMESEHSVARMLDNGGYNSVEVFRVDSADEDADIVTGYAAGGFMVRYSFIFSDEELERTGHDRYGYYWMDVNGVTQLLRKLLHAGDEGPWSEEAAEKPSYRRLEWQEKPNPAAEETWTVARLTDRGLNSEVADLARENLLFGESVTRDPMSSYEETMQASGD